MTHLRLFITAIAICLATANAGAQGRRGFDPARFNAEREQFITAEAHLSSAEAAAFFPLYNEMCDKQRTLFEKIKHIKAVKPATDEKCKAAIIEINRLQLEIDQLQGNYYQKFLKVLKPTKVFDALQAESRFHRKAMREAKGKK